MPTSSLDGGLIIARRREVFCKSVCHEGPPRPTPSPKPREKPPFHLRGPLLRQVVCNDFSKPIPWKDAKNAVIHTNPEARAFFMRALSSKYLTASFQIQPRSYGAFPRSGTRPAVYGGLERPVIHPVPFTGLLAVWLEPRRLHLRLKPNSGKPGGTGLN